VDRYLPVFLRVEGRTCLVVGGGQVATRKARALLAAGAHVVVVAPSWTPTVATLVERGAIDLRPRPFTPEDLEGVFLVVAATDDPTVNETVARAAHERRVLVNVVDAPERGSFLVPATFRRGDALVAISTNGRSPALARWVRRRLEAWIDGILPRDTTSQPEA